MRRVVAIVSLVLVFCLCVTGAMLNFYLTAKHIGKGSTGSVLDKVCTPEGSEVYNCDAVVRTKWAVVSFTRMSDEVASEQAEDAAGKNSTASSRPRLVLSPHFVEPDPATGAQPGYPVSMFGFFYYVGLGIWVVGIGRPGVERRWLHWAPSLLSLAALGVSIFFMYILLFGNLEYSCLLCMASHGINLLIFIFLILAWPPKPGDVAAAETVEEGKPSAGQSSTPPAVVVAKRPHPSVRLVFVTCALMIACMSVSNLWFLWRQANYSSIVFRHKIEEMKADSETQFATFLGITPVSIKLRDDDPIRGPKEEPRQLVLFSDFQCPACLSFARQFESDVSTFFKGRLPIVWKHYPLCTDCNTNIAQNVHPRACEAAYAAEAARLQGGDEKFWEAHDKLFANQRRIALGRQNWRAFAEELGLDPDQFIRDMGSDRVKERIIEDANQAKSLGIHGTPSIFFQGRKLQTYMLYNVDFLTMFQKKYFREIYRERLLEQRRAALQEKQEADAKNAADAAHEDAMHEDEEAAGDEGEQK